MIAAMALAAALFQAAAIEWDALAPLPYRAPPIVTAEMRDFVRREVRARKCPAPRELRVDVAVLIGENDSVRTTVPRAIDCPSVEQYVAALVANFTRGNLLPRLGAGEQWYRVSLRFTLAP
jgi:hypothetical protein